MRAVIQRVSKSSVTVGDRTTGAIQTGLMVLLGVAQGDTQKDADYLADKIINLRIFEDENGKMNRSLLEVGGEMLVISQFTLLGDCRKGRRPDFTAAGAPEPAKMLYEKTITAIRQRDIPVQTGVFAAHMEIESINDGPVTLILDSKKT